MRYVCLLMLLLVGIGEIIAQSTGKISYTISNGLQIAGVDGTNPVIYDNDWLDDTPEYTFLWLKAHNGEVNLVGNVNTRDMYGCAAGNCTYTLDDTFREWVDHYARSVPTMGLKNIPAPVRGSIEALSRPSSGRIEDTRYYVSDGSELILREARKASASKPLVVVIGGNPTSVANAYLKDPTIVDKIVVLHISGWRSIGGYNATDTWGTYVVMKKLKYINWDGNLNSWYAGNNINITPEMIASIPSNPLTDMMKQYWANIFSRWQDVGDAPVVLYLFNHSLWRNVERRTENNERTTSDTYDFLVISDNDWMNYGTDYINYMKNPANYVVSAATNSPPLVSLTSPANNAGYNQGSSITISANATDANGTISKVEFFAGSTKLGEDLTSPYSFTWNGAAAGNHSITAKATDNEGASTTSGAVSISVIVANTNPTVNITSPGNNATFQTGATVTINATAADNGGAISKVEFFNGTAKLGEDLTSPYSFSWTNVPAGTFSLTAKATDNQGATTTSAVVNISVAAVINTAPAVNITTPANNASYNQGASITISANATDANGTISKVEFYTGATKLGEDLTSPYSYTWNSATTNLGNHFLTAKATDNQGASTTSGGVSISVTAANTNPTVSITSPVTNASYTAGATVTINATAADNGGAISKVEFFNGTTKLGEDLTSPYSFTWTNVPAGTFSLTAKATDNQGATTTSGVVTISVTTANTAPAINITGPANNASFTAGASVSLTANASDANGTITKVEFFNGATKLGEDLTSPYSFSWPNVPAGTFTLTAKATDNQGATTTSAAVTISVATVNTAPVVSMTGPANNASFTAGASVSLTANASDGNGTITKVEFFNGATKLGEDLTSPYGFTWSNVPAGTYSVTARATDNQGLVSNSAAVTIVVAVANTPPVVNITSPTNNATYIAGASITIAATATDTNGSIAKVEFFSGTSKLGEDVTSPFSITWTNAPAGTHTLTAKATDNQNLMTTSASVAIFVAELPGAPLVALTSPTNNASFLPETSITLSATASQVNGSITKVEFFNGSTMLGEDRTAPYSIEWTNAPAGTHSLSAKATATNNLTSTSAVAVITVIAPNVPPVVNIVTPGNKAVINANASVNITANATDPNGTVTKVEFYNGSVKLGEDVTSPYNQDWTTSSPGVYVIVAKATDNHGMSAAHQIQLTVNPANKPPMASAGDDITTHLPAEETLIRGIGTDPEDGILTYSWTQISGPANASLRQGTLGELLVSNLVEGTYVFELSVTDNGDLTSKDQMVLIVLPLNTVLGEVPRYFTPNNDGMNDFWEWPDIELYENALLTIFNRVGQKVYESTSYQNNWNGNVDGRPLQADAYYYIIRLGNTALKGAVRIIR